jgi:hypothetical protein
MMADDYNVLLWIKFLNPCRNVLHGNVRNSFNVRCLILPRLATVEKRKILSSLTHPLQLFRLNLVVHCLDHSLQCCRCRHLAAQERPPLGEGWKLKPQKLSSVCTLIPYSNGPDRLHRVLVPRLP